MSEGPGGVARDQGVARSEERGRVRLGRVGSGRPPPAWSTTRGPFASACAAFSTAFHRAWCRPVRAWLADSRESSRGSTRASQTRETRSWSRSQTPATSGLVDAPCPAQPSPPAPVAVPVLSLSPRVSSVLCLCPLLCAHPSSCLCVRLSRTRVGRRRRGALGASMGAGVGCRN